MNAYNEFRKHLFWQDFWEILGQRAGLGTIGVFSLLLLSPYAIFALFGVVLACVYTLYARSRMQEADKEVVIALGVFLASLDNGQPTY